MATARKKNKKTPLLAIALVTLLLLLGGGVTYTLIHRSYTGKTAKYAPPTKEEKQEAEDHKDVIVKEKDQPQTPQTGNKTVIITYAGQQDQTVVISSYVSGIVEDGGTCSITLTQNGRQVTRQATAVADARHTTCLTTNIERSAFPAAGNWDLTVSYSSATTTTVMASQKVKVE